MRARPAEHGAISAMKPATNPTALRVQAALGPAYAVLELIRLTGGRVADIAEG